MKEEKRRGWHMIGRDMRLSHGDGRIAVVGETLSVDCRPMCGVQGLHASPTAFDALTYRPGPILCEVEVWGLLHDGGDVFCGLHRKVISARDITADLTKLAHYLAQLVNEKDQDHFRSLFNDILNP